MHRPGVVSLWYGTFDDEDDLFAYVEMSYPDAAPGVELGRALLDVSYAR